MKTTKGTSLFFSLLFLANIVCAQGTWTQMSNFPATARYASAFFTIGNKGYMGTGYDGAVRKDFWEYDPATDSWTQKADFGGSARFHAGCFSIGNKGYIGLGSAGYPVYSWPTDFWEYDPVTNAWTQRANFPALGRYTVASFSIGTKGYMGTGWRGPVFNDFYEYDQATDTWTQRANFGGAPRQSTTFFVIGNKGYVGAGAFNSNVYNDFWEYNPVADAWTQRATIPGPNRNAATAFTLGNYGYVGLGSSTYPVVTFLNDFWRYNPVADSWIQIINFAGVPRYAVFTFSFGCEAFLGSGESGPTSPIRTFNSDLWKFNFPITAGFTSVPSACVGTAVNFTNTSTGATNYYWDFGDNSSDTASNPSHVYAASGVYQVLLISSHNCSSDSSVQTITINPGPVPVITGPLAFCEGDSVTLTASGGTNYLWSTSETSVSIWVNTAGNYTVTATDASGCSGSTSATVLVNPLPVATVTPSGPLTFCEGGSVVLSASGGISYLWSTSETTSSISVNSSGTYMVTVTDANGCTGASVPVDVIVNSMPVAAITGGPLAFCQGGSVTLTASGGTNYLWSTAEITSSISVNTSGTYTVTVTDANTCSGSVSETVTVYPLPVATLSPPGPLAVCGNNTVTLIASPASSYVWYQDNTVIVSETGSSVTTNSPGSYYVIITDANGCTASSNVVVVSIGSIGPEVAVSSSLSDGICVQNTILIGYGPQSATLTANSPGAVSYLWSTGATTQSITVTAAGTYSVTVWDASGCSSAESPSSQVTIEVIDIRCGHGLKKIILCHVPEGNPGNPQTICVAPSAIPHHLEHHQYDCIGPCSLYYPRISPGIDDEIKVILYPNPFDNTFIIEVENNNGEEVLLNMYDVTGRLILSGYRINGFAELGAELNTGVYSIEILTGDKREMYKIVKL